MRNHSIMFDKKRSKLVRQEIFNLQQVEGTLENLLKRKDIQLLYMWQERIICDKNNFKRHEKNTHDSKAFQVLSLWQGIYTKASLVRWSYVIRRRRGTISNRIEKLLMSGFFATLWHGYTILPLKARGLLCNHNNVSVFFTFELLNGTFLCRLKKSNAEPLTNLLLENLQFLHLQCHIFQKREL